MQFGERENVKQSCGATTLLQEERAKQMLQNEKDQQVARHIQHLISPQGYY